MILRWPRSIRGFSELVVQGETVKIGEEKAPGTFERLGYVPTPRAMAGGALDENPFTNYSATVVSNPVGPEDGQVLVDRTVEAIQELWK